MPDLFANLDRLLGEAGVVIDRPRGRPHPRIPAAIYPVDYGHLPGTTAGDGDGVGVFLGSATGTGLGAVVLTADLAKRDVEVKLLVDCTEPETAAVTAFLNDTLGIGVRLVRRQ
jgi:inorganic pyrophosphatase